jgi:hypothetical protein
MPVAMLGKIFTVNELADSIDFPQTGNMRHRRLDGIRRYAAFPTKEHDMLDHFGVRSKWRCDQKFARLAATQNMNEPSFTVKNATGLRAGVTGEGSQATGEGKQPLASRAPVRTSVVGGIT